LIFSALYKTKKINFREFAANTSGALENRQVFAAIFREIGESNLLLIEDL